MEERLPFATRFVEPLNIEVDNVNTFHKLADALQTPGLVSQDTIQIKPGAQPGNFTNAMLPSVLGLTIRGADNSDPAARIVALDAVTIDASRRGLSIENVNLVLRDTLTFETVATLSQSYVRSFATGPDAIIVQPSAPRAFIEYNTLRGRADNLIHLNVGANSHDIGVYGNRIATDDEASQITVTGDDTGGAGVTLYQNTFIGSIGDDPQPMISVVGDFEQLLIRDNRFSDADQSAGAVVVESGSQRVSFLGNSFDLQGPVQGGAIQIGTGTTEPTDVGISGSRFRLGAGTAVLLDVGDSDTFLSRVEGNTFLQATIGVEIHAGNVDLGGIDLGRGSLNSTGANNFRPFTDPATSTSGAIVVAGGIGSFNAQLNLFGVADPHTVIFDAADDAANAAVNATNLLPRKKAFVAAVYLQFEQRAVSFGPNYPESQLLQQLIDGASFESVAVQIIKSSSAIDRLLRDQLATLTGGYLGSQFQASFMRLLQSGGTLEQVQARILLSNRYHPNATDTQYIKQVYGDLLGRLPSVKELRVAQSEIQSGGRKLFVKKFLSSDAYRTQEVIKLYRDLLKRTTAPSAEEVQKWVSGPLDLLSIQVRMTASVEFRQNG